MKPRSLVLGLVVLVASGQTSYLPLSLRHRPRPLPRLPRVFGYTGLGPASYYPQPGLHTLTSPAQSSPLELAPKFRPVPAVPHIRDEAILPDPVLETVPEPVQQTLPVIKTVPVPKPQPEPVFSLRRPERPVPARVQTLTPAIVHHDLAPVEARVEPLPAPLSPGATSSQWHAQDEAGNHEYGYRNENSAKHETGVAGHSVRGSYSWVDEAGYHEVHYVADDAGFRILPGPGAA